MNRFAVNLDPIQRLHAEQIARRQNGEDGSKAEAEFLGGTAEMSGERIGKRHFQPDHIDMMLMEVADQMENFT